MNFTSDIFFLHTRMKVVYMRFLVSMSTTEEPHIITRGHSLTSGGRCSTHLQLPLQLVRDTHSIYHYTIALTNISARPFH